MDLATLTDLMSQVGLSDQFADQMQDPDQSPMSPTLSIPGLVQRMKEAAQIDKKIMSHPQRHRSDLGPAVHKFAMIPEVEHVLLDNTNHATFIAEGGLYALAAWLDPYADGSMPFRRTRSCVIKVITSMSPSLNAGLDTVRDQIGMKKARIAGLVAAMANNVLETSENKRLAKRLMERWARQTYDATHEHDADLVENARAAKLAAFRNARAAEQDKPVTLAEMSGLKKEPVRAVLPQNNKLDYVINPQVAPGLEEEEIKPRARKGDALQGLEKAKRRSRAATGQAAKVVIHPSNMMV